MSISHRKDQSSQNPPAPSNGNATHLDFDVWAGAVKRQMLDSLRKRATR